MQSDGAHSLFHFPKLIRSNGSIFQQSADDEKCRRD